MTRRRRNKQRWEARRVLLAQARAELAFEDLAAQLRGRLSVVEAQVQWAWEQSGLDRLVAGLELSA